MNIKNTERKSETNNRNTTANNSKQQKYNSKKQQTTSIRVYTTAALTAATNVKTPVPQPPTSVKSLGPRSRAGLIAYPQLKPKDIPVYKVFPLKFNLYLFIHMFHCYIKPILNRKFYKVTMPVLEV